MSLCALNGACLQEWVDVCKNRGMSARIVSRLQELGRDVHNAIPWPSPQALKLHSGSLWGSAHWMGAGCKNGLMSATITSCLQDSRHVCIGAACENGQMSARIAQCLQELQQVWKNCVAMLPHGQGRVHCHCVAALP